MTVSQIARIAIRLLCLVGVLANLAMRPATGRQESNGSQTDNDVKQREFEAFKLEYEKAAERYENVYKAVWQNFYYMAFFAGGLFAFSPDALPLALRGGIGLAPLVFWFWATFLPLDYYGRQTRFRLGIIEEVVNNRYIANALYPETDREARAHPSTKEEGPLFTRLEHYRRFANAQGDENPEPSSPEVAYPGYRVRGVVCWFGLAVTTLCATLIAWYLSWFVGWHLGTSELSNNAWLPDPEPLPRWVFVAALLAISLTVVIANYVTKVRLVGFFRMCVTIVLNVAIFVLLWVSFLTGACAEAAPSKYESACWTKEDNSSSPTPIELTTGTYDLRIK